MNARALLLYVLLLLVILILAAVRLRIVTSLWLGFGEAEPPAAKSGRAGAPCSAASGRVETLPLAAVLAVTHGTNSKFSITKPYP